MRSFHQVGETDALSAARELASEWLEASDSSARFIFHASLRRAWARLSPKERELLAAQVEPKLSNPLRAEEWSGFQGDP